MSQVRPSSLRAWIMATRPATLSAAAAPVLVGTAVAYAGAALRWLPAAAALFGALLIQIGTNLANDVLDYEKGADTAARLGPVRVTQAGLLPARTVRAGMIVSFGLAALAGSYLVHVAGWPIVVIGILAIASGVAYTGGPYPLGYHGLGDLFVTIFFGFVAVCGTTFVQQGDVPLLSWLAAVPLGALATAVLVVNNVRDEPTDRGAGKRTLAVRFGRRFGVAEYVALVGASYVAAAIIAAQMRSPWPLLPLVTAPSALRLTRSIAREAGSALNATLRGTAQLLALYAVALALGIVLAA